MVDELKSNIYLVLAVMVRGWSKHARGENRLYTEIGDGDLWLGDLDETGAAARLQMYQQLIAELQVECPGVVVLVNEGDATTCDVCIDDDGDSYVSVEVYHTHREHDATNRHNCLCRACIDGFRGSGMMHSWAM